MTPDVELIALEQRLAEMRDEMAGIRARIDARKIAYTTEFERLNWLSTLSTQCHKYIESIRVSMVSK